MSAVLTPPILLQLNTHYCCYLLVYKVISSNTRAKCKCCFCNAFECNFHRQLETTVGCYVDMMCLLDEMSKSQDTCNSKDTKNESHQYDYGFRTHSLILNVLIYKRNFPKINEYKIKHNIICIYCLLCCRLIDYHPGL